MPAVQSTRRRTPAKRSRVVTDNPEPRFPLHKHPSGRWYKTVKIGEHKRFYYFGKIADDPDGVAALERYTREWPYLKEGRTPPQVESSDEGLSMADLANVFLA